MGLRLCASSSWTSTGFLIANARPIRASFRISSIRTKHWGIPFSDVTPDLPHRPRRDEILAWLRNHPGVERYAVIDDEDDELDELPLFQPSAAVGLTDRIADGVAAYLSGKTDKDMRCTRIERLFQNLRSVLKGHPG